MTRALPVPRRALVAALLWSMLCVAGPAAAVDDRIHDFPTADPDKLLRLVTTDAPGGLAVDTHGNVYFSDQRPQLTDNGRIVMLPKGSAEPITLREGLAAPGDVELTADQRGLVIAEQGGFFRIHYFGISVQLRDAAGTLRSDCTLYARTTDLGTSTGYQMSLDGYYHIANTLVPAQTQTTAELIIECGSQPTRSVPVTLGQTGQSTAFGETVVRLVVPR